jgi:hypothetical protein
MQDPHYNVIMDLVSVGLCSGRTITSECIFRCSSGISNDVFSSAGVRIGIVISALNVLFEIAQARVFLKGIINIHNARRSTTSRFAMMVAIAAKRYRKARL